MWDENLKEIAEQDPNDDDIMYLKSDVVCDDEEPSSEKPLDTTYVCWSKEFHSELVSIAVHPAFPDVAHVSVGSCDDTCKIVNFAASDGKEATEKVLGPFGETVSFCSYSPDGAYLALGLMDGNFMVYSCVNQEYSHVITLNSYPEGVEWIAWNHDSQAVMFGGSGHAVFVCNPQTQTTACFNTKDIASCGKFCTYNNVTLAVVGCSDGHLNAVKYENGSIGTMHDVALSNEMVTCLDCHDNVQMAIAGLYDGSVFLVELSRFQIVASFTDHEDTVESVQFCRGATSPMAVSCGHDGNVIMWDCGRMVKLSIVNLPENLTRMVWIPSKSMLAVGSVNGDLYTVKNGRVIKKNRPHKSTVQDLAVLPCDEDELAIISVSEDGIMAICREMFDDL